MYVLDVALFFRAVLVFGGMLRRPSRATITTVTVEGMYCGGR